ncbi:MAG: hypothetical protein HZC48_10185 [Nitrospirae bacterium]|nr:hypothetical protein [Nitrospirota bacterium]
MIIECIKEGFNITNRNWQLIFVRIITVFINIIALLIFFGVPLLVALLYLGIDIASAKDIFPSMIDDPSQFFAKYLGLLFVFIAAVLFFFTFASLLSLYTLSGTIGVLKTASLNASYRFSMSSFFNEANKHFSRLFWLLSLLLLGITLLLAAFLLFGVIGAAVVHSLALSQSTLLVFLSTFIILSGITFGSIFLFAAIVFMFYCTLISVVEEEGSSDSIKRTFYFLKKMPGAFMLYFILFVGLVAANAVLMPLSWMTVVFSLIGAFLQSYLMIVFWSALIVSYVKWRDNPVPKNNNII